MISNKIWWINSEKGDNENNGSVRSPLKSLRYALTKAKKGEKNVFFLTKGHKEMLFKPLIINEDNTQIITLEDTQSIFVSNMFDFLKIKIKFRKDGYLFFFSLNFDPVPMIRIESDSNVFNGMQFSSIDSFKRKLKNKLKKLINDIFKKDILKYDYQIQSTRKTNR